MSAKRFSLFFLCAFQLFGGPIALAQVNNFPRMVGRWVLLSPEPGSTTPAGYQIIITPDGGVFTNSNTMKGAAGRCTLAGANFCFEGVDGSEHRFICPYEVSFLTGNQELNFRLVRESDIVSCPRGTFHRTD